LGFHGLDRARAGFIPTREGSADNCDNDLVSRRP
jgi:hypothetical protein